MLRLVKIAAGSQSLASKKYQAKSQGRSKFQRMDGSEEVRLRCRRGDPRKGWPLRLIELKSNYDEIHRQDTGAFGQRPARPSPTNAQF